MIAIDLTGQRFGRLTVIERAGKDSRGEIKWLCQCDCGQTTAVLGSNLRTGHTTSCGCIQLEYAQTKKRPEITTHGGFGTRLYNIWARMKYRCNNPNCDAYPNYGGRGIQVCEEWANDFAAFRDWALANGYSDELTLDRENGNGNYEPGNCRWATAKVQQNNTRQCYMVEVDGETKSLAVWAETLGIRKSQLYAAKRTGKDMTQYIKNLKN